MDDPVTITAERWQLIQMLLQAASSEMERLQNEIREAESKTTSSDEISKQNERLVEDVRVLRQNNVDLAKRIADLSTSLATARGERDTAAADAKKVRADLSASQSQVRSTLAENSKLRQRVVQLELFQGAWSGVVHQPSPLDGLDVTDLIKLCHPDRHGGKLGELATKVTAKLLDKKRGQS